MDLWQVIQNAVREHEICTAFRALRAAEIEPVLLKGWSVGRFYPDSAVRPFGDLDLLVCDHKLLNAEKTLREHHNLNVDWHKLSSLNVDFAEPENILDRSELVPLLDARIRVLCPEDNLHFVALHMLKHAGWDPKWLVDVAVLLDSRSPSFDWDLCLGSDPTRAGWVLTALVIAHRLVGAKIAGTPAEDYRIPEWVVPAVLKAQENPDPANNQPPESIWAALAHPWRLPHGIRKRWPNPVTAAIRTGVPFKERSPFQHQLRYCARLSGSFFRRASP